MSSILNRANSMSSSTNSTSPLSSVNNIQQKEIPLGEIKASGVEADNYDIDLSPTKLPWYYKVYYKITGRDNFIGISRKVYIDDISTNSQFRYCNNYVRTAKYSILTFLPLNLLEQFSRAANIYFLIISALQLIPGISPTGRFTTLGPLLVVLAITALKEAYEDFNRHRQDDRVNHSHTLVLRDGDFVKVQWQEVRVGDIVKVKNKEYIPADLVIISTSELGSTCYIETANLDGETNLKIRQGLDETSFVGDDPERMKNLKGSLIQCEHPNNRLYNFTGSITLNDRPPVPIGVKQVVLRGAMLRNTRWVNGVAIFSGKDTKLMRNSSGTQSKKSTVEKYTNYFIIFIFSFQLALCAFCAVGYGVFLEDNLQSAWYLGFNTAASSTVGQAALSFLTFLILLNNLIPISLYVSLEVIKVVQAYFINNDIQMYHKETDTPALARTSNINEELGLVQYIFSDKTGTLTQNKMVFKKCSVAGITYGTGITEAAQGRLIREGKQATLSQIIPSPVNLNSIDDLESGNNNNSDGSSSSNVSSPNPRARLPIEHTFSHVEFDDNSLLTNLQHHATKEWIREFLLVLSVCHTVIPEVENDQVIYQASSPDEGALVSAARFFGFEFVKRNTKSVFVSYKGQEMKYDVLNILEFNSNRKRMSVIVRTPEGKLILYCKGADSVIFERLAPNQQFADITINHLQEFASDGLRTLCIAKVEIDEKFYTRWAEDYYAASTSLVDRESELERVAEAIEKNLVLIGATAIEDKLQEGVPETIKELTDAGIKIWVLTGDKQETAINIGFSCQLLSQDMELIIINEQSKENTIVEVNRRLDELRDADREDPDNNNLALIIDGQTLQYALDDRLEITLLKLARLCKSVICCRVTPSQKAQIVQMVRFNQSSITLAIGDGANDVNMIQTAHVGVGISGEEGLQAARSADFAIAQFRFLSRLLLVHGRYNYRRVAKLITYCFYKNITLYLTQLFFTIVNGWSGQTFYERLTLTAYNVAWTFFPILALGILEKDISEDMCKKYPRLYSIDRDRIFNFKTMVGWLFNGIYHAGVLFILTYYIDYLGITYQNGKQLELFEMGCLTYSCIVLTVNLKLALETRYWTWINHLTVWGSIVIYFLWLVIFGKFFEIDSLDVGSDLYSVIYHLGSSALFYLSLIFIPVVALWKDYTFKYVHREFLTKNYHIAQELQKYPKKFNRNNPDQSHKLYTGYAFSQDQK